MNYILLDLEWNQCPTGKQDENPALPFEIVEIGAIKLNDAREDIGHFSELIRPTLYTRLHFRTQEMLHIPAAELNRARLFPEVFADFIAWCGEDYRFCTWGSMDLTELQRNIDYHHIENPLPLPLFFFDVQKLFSLLYEDGKSRKSLEYAVEYLKLEKPRVFHRAFDDTWYTALIMQKMNLELVKDYASVDYYRPPRNREEEIYMQFPRYSKFVSMPFASKEEVMADKVVTATRCYQCGKMLRKKIRWFAGNSNSKVYYCLCICPSHGYLKGKIRLKKGADNCVFAVRTLKLVNEEEAAVIMEKQDAVRASRRKKKHR